MMFERAIGNEPVVVVSGEVVVTVVSVVLVDACGDVVVNVVVVVD